MKYNWSNKHPTTRWIATDSDGCMVEYSHEPYRGDQQWIIEDLSHITRVHRSSEFTGDWIYSLEEREDEVICD